MFFAAALPIIALLCGTPADAPYVTTGSATWLLPPLRYSSATRAPLAYRFTVPAGQYNIALGFIEPNATAPLQRVFAIALNGVTVLPALDLFAVAGKLPIEYTFPVSGPTVTLTLTPSVGKAVISTIKITPTPAAPAPPPSGLEADAPAICPSPLFWYVTTDTKVLLWCSSAITPAGWNEVVSLTQLIPPSPPIASGSPCGLYFCDPPLQMHGCSPSPGRWTEGPPSWCPTATLPVATILDPTPGVVR